MRFVAARLLAIVSRPRESQYNQRSYEPTDFSAIAGRGVCVEPL